MATKKTKTKPRKTKPTTADKAERVKAEKEIQSLLAGINKVLAKVTKISDKHKIEFSLFGMTMRYRASYMTKKDPPAKEGLLVSDTQWESSGLGCSFDEGSNDYYGWISKNWPEPDYDDDIEPESDE